MNKQGLSTLSLHAGQVPDPATGSRTVPIYQTASYVFKNTEHAAALYALEENGHLYTRLTNPTTSVFEDRVAAIEGGTAGVATATGASAIMYALLAVTRPGDEVVAAKNLYGGTSALLSRTFTRSFARKVTFVNAQKPEEFKKAITPKTRAIHVETIDNPTLAVPDFEAIAKIAHDAGIPLIVDNTVGVGLMRPIDYGADIIASSATKYIGGHGTSLGGIIVDSGKFQWNNGKFPEFTEPDAGYHGLAFWDAFSNVPNLGNIALAAKIRATLLYDTGATLSPFNAHELLIGLETLPLRQQKHCENALALAQWLKQHPAVAWVNYPGLPGNSNHAIASKYLKKGYGGMLGFGIKGGLEAGKKLINSVKLISHAANFGDAKSLIIHPVSTTHAQLTEAEQLSAGITPDYIRFSVGLEDVEDLKADLTQALSVSQS